jgi:hypothetical protein
VKLSDFSAAHLAARDQIWQRYRDQGNVNSVGLGLRMRDGSSTAEPVVVVSVTRKFPSALVAPADLLPSHVMVEGQQVGVDVVRAGPFTRDAARPATPAGGVLTGLSRPMKIGDSIGPLGTPDSQTGTLGAFVVDKKTGGLCVLSCAHVLADVDLVPLPIGTRITQPGVGDGGTTDNAVGSLLRIADLSGGQPLDAAIASIDKGITTDNVCGVPGMTAASPSQPAVGLVIAGSATSHTLCQPIDQVLTALDIDFPVAGSYHTAGQAAVGDAVQKVGRTTGYSSLNITQVGMTTSINYGLLGPLDFTGLILIDGVFSDTGDAGAVICTGGSGSVGAPVNLPLGICAFMTALGNATAIPALTSATDLDYIDRFRDQYLAKTAVGQLLIGLFYINSDAIAQRIQQDLDSGLITAQHQANAQSLYNAYWPMFTAAVDSPDTAGVITQQEFNSLVVYFSGMYEYGYFSHDEAVAINDIINVVLQPTIGMNASQLTDYFNRQDVYDQVVTRLSPVTSISFVAGSAPL